MHHAHTESLKPIGNVGKRKHVYDYNHCYLVGLPILRTLKNIANFFSIASTCYIFFFQFQKIPGWTDIYFP